MITVTEFVSVLPWYAWVAIIAIVFGVGSGVIQTILKHRERMEMIRQGIHPDRPESESSSKSSIGEL